jgi:hypothetical protein
MLTAAVCGQDRQEMARNIRYDHQAGRLTWDVHVALAANPPKAGRKLHPQGKQRL